MIFIEDNAKTTPDKNYRDGYVNIYGLETVIVDNTPVAPGRSGSAGAAGQGFGLYLRL